MPSNYITLTCTNSNGSNGYVNALFSAYDIFSHARVIFAYIMRYILCRNKRRNIDPLQNCELFPHLNYPFSLPRSLVFPKGPGIKRYFHETIKGRAHSHTQEEQREREEKQNYRRHVVPPPFVPFFRTTTDDLTREIPVAIGPR